MKFRLPRLQLFRKRRGGREEERAEERPSEEVVYKREVVEVLPRIKRSVSTIFVGSSKGGSGKSFISTNLAIIAAVFSRRDVYAIDLDLDNATLSTVLQPSDMSIIISKLEKSRVYDYLNVATVLHQGMVPRIPVLKLSEKTFACNGVQVAYEIRVVPAYNILKQKEQQRILRQLDAISLREGVESLLDFVERLDVVAIFDGKQKSSLGIEYEPIYRLMIERASTFILVTEPPYLGFSELIAPYRDVRDIASKTVIVVNKASMVYKDRLLVLIRDAVSYGIPVFVIPEVPEDGELYRQQLTAPAGKSLSRRTAIYTMALAYYLGLVDDERARVLGCFDHIKKLLHAMDALYRQVVKR